MTKKWFVGLIYLFSLSMVNSFINEDATEVRFDRTSTISISSSPSAFVLVRPYTCQKEGAYCVGSPTYGGMINKHSTWTTTPSPIITQEQSAKGVLEDTIGFAGSEGSLVYNVTLGNAQDLIESKKWLPSATKTVAQLRFSFQYGLTDDNDVIIEPKAFFNPASLARATWEVDNDFHLSYLQLGEFYLLSTVDGKEYFNTIPKKGSPIKIEVFFRAMYPTFEELWDAWAKTAFQYGEKYPDMKQDVSIILMQMAEMFDLEVNFRKIDFTNLKTWSLDCTRPKNQKVCNYKILDDWDYNYNSLMWALGRTGGPELDLSSLEEVESTLERYGDLKKTSCFKGKALDNDVVVAILVNKDSQGRLVKPEYDLEVTHVSYFHHELLAWTSKFGTGPLVVHDSPMELSHYGSIASCYRRKRKSEN